MDIWTGLLLAGVVCLALFVHFKKKAKRGIGPLAPNKKGWFIEHSQGTSERPITNGNGWSVAIPASPGYLGAVKFYDPFKMRVGGTLTLKCRVVGNGTKPVQADLAHKQATVTLILQRVGDQGTGRGQYENYRWYSSKMVNLLDGTYEISVPVTSQSFGGIMGSHDPKAFEETLKDIWNIQIGFGSAGGRAHSVHASEGPVTFYMDSLTYQD